MALATRERRVDLSKMLNDFTCDFSSGSLFKFGQPISYSKKNGYLLVRVQGEAIPAHRVVWAMAHKKWPFGIIDHIDGDRANNALTNLRDVTSAINNQNKGGPLLTNQSTGYLGANYHSSNGKGRIRAQIWVGGKNKHIGYFDTPEQAFEAYIEAKKRLHPGLVLERLV